MRCSTDRRRAPAAVPLALVLLVSGCTGIVQPNSEEAAFIDGGAVRIEAGERAALFVGNTLRGDGFAVHYVPDGTKRITTDDGIVVERRWRVREDGVFCEELTVSGNEICADAGRLYVKDGLYRAFRPDGTASPLSFRITPGDDTAQVSTAPDPAAVVE